LDLRRRAQQHRLVQIIPPSSMTSFARSAQLSRSSAIPLRLKHPGYRYLSRKPSSAQAE